jgi:hypothetical protein
MAGEFRVESNFPREFAANPTGAELSNASYSEADPTSTSHATGSYRRAGDFVGRTYFLNIRSDRAFEPGLGGITDLQGRRSDLPLLKVESKSAFSLNMDHEWSRLIRACAVRWKSR